MWKFFTRLGEEKTRDVKPVEEELASATGVSGAITATTAATAQVVVTLPSVTFDGITKIMVEVEMAYAYMNTANILEFHLWENNVDLGRISYIQVPTQQIFLPVTMRTRPFTPSAGAKVYSVRAYVNAGSASIGDVVWGRITSVGLSGYIGSTPSYGVAFPANPTDGQEAILVDSVTNPSYQWRFRYNENSTSAYKWEFIGGAPILANNNVNATTTSAAFTEPDGNSRVTVPRAGDYIATATGRIQTSATANTLVQVGIGLTTSLGSAIIAEARINLAAASSIGYAGTNRFNSLNAGDVIAQAIRNGSADGQLIGYGYRSLSVLPVRCS